MNVWKPLRWMMLNLPFRSAMKAALDHSPAAIRDPANYWIARNKAREGYRLVDEEQLAREYRRALLLLCDEIGPESIGDYLEFGVFYGSSLACMHDVLQELGLDHVRLFGFDSFLGLPKAASDSEEQWEAGQFRSSYRFAREYLTERGVDWSRVFLIKGWFGDTLIPRLVQEREIAKASVIMIDCDMYRSAKEALDFCAPLIRDQAIIVFDDWNSGGLAERDLGEKRAFEEFLAENRRFSAVEFGGYSLDGEPNAKIFRVARSDEPEPY